MRILVYNWRDLAHPLAGGAEVYTDAVATEWVAAGHEVTLFAAALPRMVEKRFAFDLELFVVARRLGYTRVAELPVRIQERFSSTISPKAVWGMLLDTLGIFYRLRVLHYYDRPVAPLARRQSADRVAGGEGAALEAAGAYGASEAGLAGVAGS